MMAASTVSPEECQWCTKYPRRGDADAAILTEDDEEDGHREEVSSHVGQKTPRPEILLEQNTE